MRWALGTLAFLVSVAFWPGAPSFAELPKWATFGVGVAVLSCFTRIRPTPAHWWLLAVLLYAAASITWSVVPWDGLGGLCKLTFLAAAFCLGAEQEDLTPVYVGAGMGIAVSAVVATLQWRGYPVAEQVIGPAGLYGNKNFMGEAAALAMVALALSPVRTWWLLPTAAFALWLSGSRGGVAGVAVAGISWLARRAPVTAFAVAVIGAVAVADLARTANVWRLTAIGERTVIWADTLDGMTWFGRGIGSFYTAMPEHGPRLSLVLHERTMHAHSDILELVFELGVGACGFAALLALALACPRERERLVLAAFVVAGLTGFPLYEPSTALLAAIVAGYLCGLGHRLRHAVVCGGTHDDGVATLRGPLYHQAVWPAQRRPDFSARSLHPVAAGLCAAVERAIDRAGIRAGGG